MFKTDLFNIFARKNRSKSLNQSTCNYATKMYKMIKKKPISISYENLSISLSLSLSSTDININRSGIAITRYYVRIMNYLIITNYFNFS